MLEKRIIPALLLKDSGLIKTIKFTNEKYVGDPINTVKLFNDKEVDELIILDIGARFGSGPNLNLLGKIASESFMPLGYGGGIKTIEEMSSIFNLGYEKVLLGLKGIEDSELVKSAVKAFGSQSIIAVVDIVERGLFIKKNYIYDYTRKKTSQISIEDHIKRIEEIGFGEIVLNFVSRDGTCEGYDIASIEKISKLTRLPIVALGGAWSQDHIRLALSSGADAAAAGSMFIYYGPHKAVLVNYPKRKEIEAILERAK